MKKFVTVVSIALIASLLAGCKLNTNKVAEQKSQKQVKIGALLPLSGDYAFWGDAMRRGIDMAIDEAKKEGVDLKVVYEDDQDLRPAKIVTAAKKLLEVDKIDVGVTMIIEEIRPSAPLFNDKKVPLLAVWDDNKFIRESGEYIYTNGFSTEKAGEQMAEYAYNTLGLKRVAMVLHLEPWGEVISKSFTDKFKELGGEVVYSESFQRDVTDYKTTIAKIKQLKADGVYMALVPMTSVQFITQAKELGLNSVLMTGDTLFQDVIDATGNAAENIYFTNIYPSSKDYLTKKHQDKYGSDPVNLDAISLGYDGTMKIAEAVKNARSSGKSIKEEMDNIFGQSRAANKEEKLFKVVSGQAEEIKP